MKGMFSKAEGGGMGEWTHWLHCFFKVTEKLILFTIREMRMDSIMWKKRYLNKHCAAASPFKGVVHPKMEMCHDLLTLLLIQTCITYFIYRIFWRKFITHISKLLIIIKTL